MAVFQDYLDKQNAVATGTAAPVVATPQMAQFSARQFGGLQPLVSDLLTENASTSRYRPSTYSGDAQAIQDRLSQYSAYDPKAFGGLGQYLAAQAAGKNNGALYFKPDELKAKLSSLSGVDETNYAALQPLLGDMKGIGSMDGKQYFEKQALSDLMNKYVLSQEGTALDPSFADLKKLTTLNGYDFYGDADPTLTAEQLATDKYNLVKGGGTPSALYAPGFQDPRAIENGKSYYSDPWGFAHEAMQVKDTPYYFAPTQGHTRSGTADTWFGVTPTEGMTNAIYGGQSGYLFDPNKVELSKQLTPERINDRYAEKKSGGGLFGAVFNFLDPILDTIDPMHDKAQNFVTKLGGLDSQEQAFSTIMPMIVDYFLPGVGSAASAVNSASTGNWAGAVTNALGAYTGMSGMNLGVTDNAAVNQALTRAAITGVGSAASGNNYSDVLRNMALSGLTSYGGGMLGGYTRGLGSLGKIATNTAYGAGTGALRDAVLGNRNRTSTGALNALINSSMREARGVDFSKYWS